MSVFALALSATPALAGSPAVHSSFDAAGGGTLVCGGNTYDITSGSWDQVEHIGTSASGNTSYAETITVSNVMVTDQDGVHHRVVGVEHFGQTANIHAGGQMTWLFKFQILGTSDSLNLVVRFGPTGDVVFHDAGTCSAG